MTARDPIDVLAEVLRIGHHGGMRRPLWQDMAQEHRDPWLRYAQFAKDGMARRGFELVPTSDASGGTKA